MGRKPAVADAFYLASSDLLKTQVSGLVEENLEKDEVVGIVSPHAGFVYSGNVAGAVYSRITLPETVILLGPNHTGYGPAVSIMAEGSWEMPLGEVEVDSATARRLLERSSAFDEDQSAHTSEHSLEVQIPFIQHFTSEFKIVPIIFMHMSLERCEELGLALAGVIKGGDKKVLLVGSTDMTHFEPHETAVEKDRMAIDCILALDHRGLYETVIGEGITMCGVIPTTVMLAACKELGASEAHLVKYQTSGDVSGDFDSVVGYAGVLVS